jgi:hypothetical protein
VERRQAALLARDSVRQILAGATSARDADPAQVALWTTALALTPPFLVAVRKVIDYPFLLRAPAEYVDRVVMADRLFFMLYGMLATALVTALVWDSLSPTRHDYEVTGALPVRPCCCSRRSRWRSRCPARSSTARRRPCIRWSERSRESWRRTSWRR